MFDLIEDHDIKNSLWISLFMFAGAILAVALLFWMYSLVTGEVALHEPGKDEEAAPAVAAQERTVVQVANATNITGLASQASNRLTQLDFVTLQAGNLESTGQSIIYYQTEPISRQEDAERIAEVFSISASANKKEGREDRVLPFPDDFDFENLNPEAEVLVVADRDFQL